jgi:hypothetical protein
VQIIGFAFSWRHLVMIDLALSSDLASIRDVREQTFETV